MSRDALSEMAFSSSVKYVSNLCRLFGCCCCFLLLLLLMMFEMCDESHQKRPLNRKMFYCRAFARFYSFELVSFSFIFLYNSPITIQSLLSHKQRIKMDKKVYTFDRTKETCHKFFIVLCINRNAKNNEKHTIFLLFFTFHSLFFLLDISN